MKKKLLLLSLSSLMSIPLFACSNTTQVKDGWDIKEADYQNALKFESQVSRSNGKMELTVEDEFGSFRGKVNSEDVILFNINKLKEIKGKKYYTYSDIKSAEVPKESFSSEEDGTGFTVTFNGDTSTRYGIIANKNTNLDNQYVLSGMKEIYSKKLRLHQEEGEWEKAYIETKADKGVDPTVPIQIEAYVVKFMIGIATSQPLAIADGVYGLLGMIGGAFKPAEPSIADVLEKLAEIDGKLDDLSAEIQKNQRELINQAIYQEAQIDKALIAIYQQDYTDYVTNYLDPIDSIERDYTQYIDYKLKQLVKNEPQTINLRYKRNEENKYVQLAGSESNYHDFGVLSIDVKPDSYSNAQGFLALHNDTICEGFMDEFNKDIDAIVEKYWGKSLPTDQFTKEDYRRAIYNAIIDNFLEEEFSPEYNTDGYKKAQNMVDKAILVMRRISGVSTGESIIGSIIKRMQVMYNFGYESKAKVTALLANMKYTIEKYLAMTSLAARYAKINQADIATEYDRAIETIQAYSKANDEIPDNYCYITNTVIDSGFIWSRYNAEFRNLGEHPDFRKEFVTEKINDFNRFTGHMDRTRIDLNKTAIVKPNDQRKIFKRFTLLVQAGIEQEVDYLKYLVNNKGMDKHSYDIQQTMINDRWMTDDTSRILSEYEGIKTLTEKDTFNFTCIENGNSEGGEWFTIGKQYKYKSSHDQDCWSGEKATALFIDAHNGTDRESHLISAYAKFSDESFWYTDNEHWAFSSNPGGSYFYLMYTATAK